jgi:hypothetical protein
MLYHFIVPHAVNDPLYDAVPHPVPRVSGSDPYITYPVLHVIATLSRSIDALPVLHVTAVQYKASFVTDPDAKAELINPVDATDILAHATFASVVVTVGGESLFARV